MSQDIGLIHLNERVNNKDFKVVSYSKQSFDKLNIFYYLIKYDNIYEEIKVTFYSLYLSLYDMNMNFIEDDYIRDITTIESFALEILNIISRNKVTPISSYDCVYDILSDKF